MPLIVLNEITKSYGRKTILEKYSLQVNEGEFLGIMGSSGSGKSTILNIIGLLEDFDNGEIIIDGHKDVLPNSRKANKILREKISYLFQNFALVDDETVAYNLNLALRYIKGNSEREERKDEPILKSL